MQREGCYLLFRRKASKVSSLKGEAVARDEKRDDRILCFLGEKYFYLRYKKDD